MRTQQRNTMVAFALLTILACAFTGSPNATAQANPLKGIWIYESVNSIDVTDKDYVWTCDDSTITTTFTTHAGTERAMSYTMDENTINTMVKREASAFSEYDSRGSSGTIKWSYSFGRLTLFEAGVEYVLQRPQGKESLVGSWMVTVIIGDSVRLASGCFLNFTKSRLEIFETNRGDTTHTSLFDYTNDGSRLVLTAENWDSKETTTQAEHVDWILDGIQLTLVLPDKTKMLAVRM